ncbi:MAG: tetratricopeptide repeat protein [Candidatus Aminicenantia bacterium]
MKRKLKKRIKQNELVSSLKWLTNFFRENQREILIGFSIVGVFAIIFFGYRTYSQIRIQRENVTIGRFLANSTQISSQNLPSRWRAFEHLKVASELYSKGNFKESLDEISKIKSSKKDIFYYQSLLLKGNIYKSMGELNKAIEEYKKIVNNKPKNFPFEIALLRIAICYKELGKKEEAIINLRRIIGEFPDSPYFSEAESLLQRLQPHK